VRRILFFQDHYRLNLWCEHPGYWHPWPPATYQLDPPKDWLVKVSPYAKLIFKALQLVVPIAGDAVEALLTPDQYARAQGDVDMMKTLVGDLPTKPDKNLNPALRVVSPADSWTRPESQGLLALRSTLFALDKAHAFGGLRRVLAPTGELLWICPDHYPEYDPGLPQVP
jgi:internalin A